MSLKSMLPTLLAVIIGIAVYNLFIKDIIQTKMFDADA